MVLLQAEAAQQQEIAALKQQLRLQGEAASAAAEEAVAQRSQVCILPCMY